MSEPTREQIKAALGFEPAPDLVEAIGDMLIAGMATEKRKAGKAWHRRRHLFFDPYDRYTEAAIKVAFTACCIKRRRNLSLDFGEAPTLDDIDARPMWTPTETETERDSRLERLARSPIVWQVETKR